MVLTLVEKGLKSNGRAASLEKSDVKSDADANSCSAADTSLPDDDKVILPDKVLERLYQSYSIKQRQAGQIWFVIASILFDIWSLVVPLDQRIECRGKFWNTLFIFF